MLNTNNEINNIDENVLVSGPRKTLLDISTVNKNIENENEANNNLENKTENKSEIMELIKRSYSLQPTTIKKLQEMKVYMCNPNVSYNEIVDEAIRYYYSSVVNKKIDGSSLLTDRYKIIGDDLEF